MRLKQMKFESQIIQHIQLLDHSGYGVIELRIFKPKPLIAYADNSKAVIRLCRKMNGKTSGIYVGVQPRPLDLFENVPNCWKPAISSPQTNCACDRDIEFITACFFDIDVVSTERRKGCPASEEELEQSLQAATLLSRENGLALSSTICCSGSGHYLLVPVVPISIDGHDVAAKFRQSCHQLAQGIAHQADGVKIDPVYNLSRVMRLMGTVNGKGQPSEERPHRRAHFITEPMPAKSMALHQMILNTEIAAPVDASIAPADEIECDLTEIEMCEFTKRCRKHPRDVSEPLWFAMITNLAHLKGGTEVIHEISCLDAFRYDRQQTQMLIERVQSRGYSPANCKTIRNSGFYCPKYRGCQVKAPKYLGRSFSI
jgi:hypothetical protein